MDRQNVLEKTRKITAEHLGIELEKVHENSSFIDDLGADSLDIVELVMAAEEDFDVEIPDDTAESFTTVKDVVDYITSKVGG